MLRGQSQHPHFAEWVATTEVANHIVPPTTGEIEASAICILNFTSSNGIYNYLTLYLFYP